MIANDAKMILECHSKTHRIAWLFDLNLMILFAARERRMGTRAKNTLNRMTGSRPWRTP